MFTSLCATLIALQSGQFAIMAQLPAGPKIRIFNAVQAQQDLRLDFWLDGARVASDVASSGMSGPFTAAGPAAARLIVRREGGTPDMLDLNVTLSGRDHLLILVGNPDTKLSCVDVAPAPPTGNDDRPQVDFVNAIGRSNPSAAVDLYLLATGDKLSDCQPKSSDVAFAYSAAAAVPPGTYTVVATRAGTKEIVAQSEPVYVAKGKRKIAVVLPQTGGATDSIFVINL